MAHVPQSLEDFQSKEFWEAFFKSRDGRPFEWYCEYEAINSLILQHCRGKRVLIPGCGNSDLSSKLFNLLCSPHLHSKSNVHRYDDGVTEITNLDFSKLVIREMLTKNLRQRPQMKWLVMDITKMRFSVDSFDVVLDKGALDALMGDSEAESDAEAQQYLNEVFRVMTSSSSVFFCVSLLQKHVLKKLLISLRTCFKVGITELELSSTEDVSEIRSFLVTAERKLAHEIDTEIKLEIKTEQKSVQIQDIEQVIEEENTKRGEAASATNSMTKHHDFDSYHPGARCVFNSLRCPYSKKLKKKLWFKAIVLDNVQSYDTACAVFIVPQGCENSWMYRSIEGQWTVSKQCQAQRVILVFLQSHNQPYVMEDIKSVLSPGVLKFIPKHVRYVAKTTPYLTANEQSEVHVNRATYKSEINKEIIIRDVIIDNAIYRRMLFVDSLAVVQSETRLIAAEIEKQPSELDAVPDVATLSLDVEYLSAAYHRLIVYGLSCLEQVVERNAMPRVVLIGLGAGVLPAFLMKNFSMDLTVVELDAATVNAAQQWFGFELTMPVEIADGVEYIARRASESDAMDVLVVEAGGSDDDDGMSCPPASFVTASFFSAARQCIGPKGIIIVNFVSRSTYPLNSALTAMASVFAHVYFATVDGDLNRVVIASEQPLQFSESLSFITKQPNWRPQWHTDHTKYLFHKLSIQVKDELIYRQLTSQLSSKQNPHPQKPFWE